MNGNPAQGPSPPHLQSPMAVLTGVNLCCPFFSLGLGVDHEYSRCAVICVSWAPGYTAMRSPSRLPVCYIAPCVCCVYWDMRQSSPRPQPAYLQSLMAVPTGVDLCCPFYSLGARG